MKFIPNPFSISRIPEGETFLGESRKELADLIIKELDINPLAMFHSNFRGGRTSFLKHLQEKTNGIYIDTNFVPTPDDFFKVLAKHISYELEDLDIKELPKYTCFEEYVSQLNEVLGQHKEKITILLDSVAVPFSDVAKYREFVKSTEKMYNLKWILSNTTKGYKIIESEEITKKFDIYTLKPFSRKETYYSMQQIAGDKLIFDKDSLRLCYQLSKGIPFFINVIGNIIFEYVYFTKKAKDNQVNSEIVRNAMNAIHSKEESKVITMFDHFNQFYRKMNGYRPLRKAI